MIRANESDGSEYAVLRLPAGVVDPGDPADAQDAAQIHLQRPAALRQYQVGTNFKARWSKSR
jgi:hypothetical protein